MKDRIRFIVYGLIFVFVLGLLSGLASARIYEKRGVHLVVSSLLSTGILLFLALYNYEPLKTPRQRERALLKKVRESWIENLSELEKFLPGTSLMELKYKWEDSKVDGNWTLSQITEAFETAGRLLLIRGAEGSGKTTSALMLTRHLVKRAREDARQPIPVVLNLSNWSPEYKQLEDWLVAELRGQYDVSEDLGGAWLKTKRLLLVLDGLNEVRDRDLCVDSITDFLKTNPPGLVVSDRWDDDDDSSKPRQPGLRGSIVVKNLEEADVGTYLEVGIPQVLAVAESARLKLATSPLDLILMLMIGEDGIAQGRSRDELVETFIERQLERDQSDPMKGPYSGMEIKKKLQWLAQGMERQQQTIFFIDHLQPSWLASTLPYILLSRLMGAAAIMILGVLLMLMSQVVTSSLPEQVSMELFTVKKGLWWWLVITIGIGGLTRAALDARRFKKSEPQRKLRVVRGPLSRGRWKGIALQVGTFCITFSPLAWWIFGSWRGFSGAYVYGVSFGLFYWFRGLTESRWTDIRTADKITIVGSRLLKGIPAGALVAALLGLVAVPSVSHFHGAALAWRLYPLFLILGGAVGAVVGGLDKVSIIEKSSATQGLWLSIRNTVLIWLVVGGSSAAIIWGYTIFLTGRADTTLRDPLFFGSVLGLLVGFAYGGLDVIYHLALRLILSYRRVAYLIHYERFLDHAASLGFLRKVGGGYMFLHRSLLKQSADLEPHSRVRKETTE